MEIRASECSAPMPSTIDGTRLYDDRRDADDEDDVAVGGGGEDVPEAVKSLSSGDQDEVMKDVDSRVSYAGTEVGMDLDLAGDGKDYGREVGDLQSTVFEDENGAVGFRRDMDHLRGHSSSVNGDDDPVELSVSVSGSEARDEDSEGEGEDLSLSRYDSLLNKFDKYVQGSGSSCSRASSFEFRVGDLVWGKVKSHPWWPGHIFKDEFASSSVRRTLREGHILVAFFGDSSYGWFDPAELVPFDEHFAEKSRQTSAKSFVKAVEEAVDEVCRRRSLGLACKCRNPQNFRPANEEGYFAVDLGDFDYVAFYPQTLIDQSRDRFQPLETLRFVSQLARNPLNCDQKSLDVSQNKAVSMALRKAMFEEFDDTYSEAFGHPVERPIRSPKNLADDTLRVQAQAQLSGPLVIAEALCDKKATVKSVKVKDKSKKNRYLLKRRDEIHISKDSQIGSNQLDSPASLTYVEGESELASEGSVLQKRSPTTSLKTHLPSVEKLEPVDQTNLEVSVKKENDTLSEMKTSGPWHEAAKSCSFQAEAVDAADLKHKGCAQVVPSEDLHKTQRDTRMAEASETMQPVASASLPPAKSLGSSKKMVFKKPKAPKHSIGEVNTVKAAPEETKMMKKKKKRKNETMVGHPEKRVAAEKPVPASRLACGKDTEGNFTLLPGTLVGRPLDVSAYPDLKFQDVLSDLKIFALDPFHGAERNSLAVAKQVFLKFRSLVYQKSLLLAPKREPDSVNADNRKSATAGTLPDIAHNANSKDMSIKKPARALGRPDDPTKGGRKRLLSDRPEEMGAKKSKKISDIKSLANEKKAGSKILEPGLQEKAPSILGKVKINKAVPPTRRVQPPSRVPEPTMLVLKFPQGTNMPTAAALKARFARFGPLDLESLRVFWQSSTCRVVFRYKADAQKAYEFAVSNTGLFGSGNIRCQLREVGIPEPETKEESKEEAYPELPRYYPPLPSPSQLKSILKKQSTTADEALPALTRGRGNARVKFVLDGEESSGRGREEVPMLGSRNFVNGNNIASFASNTNVAMDFNSRNTLKVIPPSSSLQPSTSNMAPLHPQHQFTIPAPQIVHHQSEAPPPPPPNMMTYHHHQSSLGTSMDLGSVDISQQMMSMLTRCNEVVSSIKAHLGYVPYHSL